MALLRSFGWKFEGGRIEKKVAELYHTVHINLFPWQAAIGKPLQDIHHNSFDFQYFSNFFDFL